MMAAQHAQRVQEVTDAFRLADATAPARARTLAELQIAHAAEVEELARAGVLVQGPRRDSWYLSEAAVVARRRGAGRLPRKIVVLLLVLAGLLAVGLGVFVGMRG